MKIEAILTNYDGGKEPESLLRESLHYLRKLNDWSKLSDQGLKLRCGELTKQEIRTIRAVLNSILA